LGFGPTQHQRPRETFERSRRTLVYKKYPRSRGPKNGGLFRMYLTVVMDWFSRCVLSWRLSNTLDGRGRWLDNVFVERLWRTVKYEHLYLHEYATPRALEAGLAGYFPFYNEERIHAALGYRTPRAVYLAAGGVMVVRINTRSRARNAKSSLYSQWGMRFSGCVNPFPFCQGLPAKRPILPAALSTRYTLVGLTATMSSSSIMRLRRPRLARSSSGTRFAGKWSCSFAS